ncbi:MAG: hypothetical protein IJH61_02970, partial [Eubacteriaceae bacterium]|nr:hypothetical protein [Eubacteriaceae bacterium]
MNDQSKKKLRQCRVSFFECVIVFLLTDKKYFFNCVQLIEKKRKRTAEAVLSECRQSPGQKLWAFVIEEK